MSEEPKKPKRTPRFKRVCQEPGCGETFIAKSATQLSCDPCRYGKEKR